MTIQQVRSELSVALSTLGPETYDYLPGSANLPAIVVGLPDRIDHTVTRGYQRIELPVYVVAQSSTPVEGETAVLDLVAQVAASLKGLPTGTSYVSLRVRDTTEIYPIEIGSTEVHSAKINTEIMIQTPQVETSP